MARAAALGQFHAFTLNSLQVYVGPPWPFTGSTGFCARSPPPESHQRCSTRRASIVWLSPNAGHSAIDAARRAPGDATPVAAKEDSHSKRRKSALRCAPLLLERSHTEPLAPEALPKIVPASCTGTVKFSYPEAPKVTVSVSPTTKARLFEGSAVSRALADPPEAASARSR